MHDSSMRLPAVWVVMAVLPCASAGWGQELSLLYGQMATLDAQNSSFSWQVDFRHTYRKYFAWSASYINEGHIVNHKRDGGASQLWVQVPIFENRRLWMSVGGGAYRYFDTTLAANGVDTQDLHGWAQIYSAAITWYAPERWFVRLLANRLVTGTISWRFGDHWLARFLWHRVVSRYQPDSDVFMIGPGYRWGD